MFVFAGIEVSQLFFFMKNKKYTEINFEEKVDIEDLVFPCEPTVISKYGNYRRKRRVIGSKY